MNNGRNFVGHLSPEDEQPLCLRLRKSVVENFFIKKRCGVAVVCSEIVNFELS